MKFGVVVFPGSNCDHDCYHVIKHVLNESVEYLWHESEINSKLDCLVLPGGFSYGDHLRAGAIARFSKVMLSVQEFAEAGGLVIGICNGFQILLEAGLLPGAMQKNKSLKFISKFVPIKVRSNANPFTSKYKVDEVINVPIAHAEGNYYADTDTLKRLQDNNQIIFQYCSADGEVSSEYNPNGSLGNIAGISNKQGNVMGMMPHPERCGEAILGNDHGLRVFSSLLG